MKRTDEYLNAIHRFLIESALVAHYTVIRQRLSSQEGFLRVRIVLSNGDFLEAAEFFHATPDGVRIKDYRHQWMDGERTQLRKRWDSKPHYPHLANFPYHCHDGSEDNVTPSERLSIRDVLMNIQNEIEGSR